MRRYAFVARLYDLISWEWPVYRTGRRLGISQLRLRPGDVVLDVGCGTGLSFPALLAAVGPDGLVVGLDSSAPMLAAAARKTESAAQRSVLLLLGDASDLSTVMEQEPALGHGVDAVLFTYALSLMHPWQAAWQQAFAVARPGARVVVVDLALPRRWWRLTSPLTRLAGTLGGADLKAHPWMALRQHCNEVSATSAWGAHVQIWAGTVPLP